MNAWICELLQTASEPLANNQEFRLFLGMDPYIELTAELAAQTTSFKVDASGNHSPSTAIGSVPTRNSSSLTAGVSSAVSQYAKGRFWTGSTLDDFEFLDESEIQRNLYLDCSFNNNFKVRGPTYRADKRKVS